MMDWMRGPLSAGVLALAAISLAGCDSMGGIQTQSAQQDQITPLPSSTVATGTLPPIGAAGAPAPGLSGQPVLGGQPAASTTPVLGPDGLPLPSNSQVASTQQLPATDPFATAPTGQRDLSGGLTIEKLLGGWTIASGQTTCRLNLTYTAKDGTSRYRASTPGCQINGLATVGSWQLAGSQVQLFDEAGTMVAALVLSGNRFIGTSAGGAAISMTA